MKYALVLFVLIWSQIAGAASKSESPFTDWTSMRTLRKSHQSLVVFREGMNCANLTTKSKGLRLEYEPQGFASWKEKPSSVFPMSTVEITSYDIKGKRDCVLNFEDAVTSAGSKTVQLIIITETVFDNLCFQGLDQLALSIKNQGSSKPFIQKIVVHSSNSNSLRVSGFINPSATEYNTLGGIQEPTHPFVFSGIKGVEVHP